MLPLLFQAAIPNSEIAEPDHDIIQLKAALKKMVSS